MDSELPITRRELLASVGVAATAVAGCSSVDGEPGYVEGEVSDADGQPRTAEEVRAAEAVAVREPHDAVSQLEGLAIRDHAFVVESGYRGSVVQGIVENVGDDRVEIVEIRVRVYADDGGQLGRYLDRTGDLDGGTTWRFEAIILEAPADIAEYDIAVLGAPA